MFLVLCVTLNIGQISVVQRHEDVMDLRDRVDHLDCQQQQQLDELRSEPPAYVMNGAQQRLSTNHHHHDSPARSVDSNRSDS